MVKIIDQECNQHYQCNLKEALKYYQVFMNSGLINDRVTISNYDFLCKQIEDFEQAISLNP